MFLETRSEATLYLNRQRAILPQVYHNRRNNEFIVNSVNSLPSEEDSVLPLPVKEEEEDNDDYDLNLPMPIEQHEEKANTLNLPVKEEQADFTVPLPVKEEVLPLPVKEEALPLPVKEEVLPMKVKKEVLPLPVKKVALPSTVKKGLPPIKIILCDTSDSDTSEGDEELAEERETDDSDEIIFSSASLPKPIQSVKAEPKFAWVPLTLPVANSVKVEIEEDDVEFAWLPSSTAQRMPVPGPKKTEFEETASDDVDFVWLPSGPQRLPIPRVKAERVEVAASSTTTKHSTTKVTATAGSRATNKPSESTVTTTVMVQALAAATAATVLDEPSTSHGVCDALTGFHAFSVDVSMISLSRKKSMHAWLFMSFLSTENIVHRPLVYIYQSSFE